MLCAIDSLPPLPAPGKRLSLFHSYHFAFSRMSYRWTHKVFSLLHLAFLLGTLYLRYDSVVACISGLFFFTAE